MDPIPPTVTAHVAAGTVALAAYWTAGLAKKGSPLHRRAGQVFLLAMLGILASGVPLVLAALARGQENAAAFLGYLLLLVAQGCWSAWRAVRDRRTPQRYFSPVFWSLTGATVVAGAAMVWLGVHIGQPIFAVFGLGISTASRAGFDWDPGYMRFSRMTLDSGRLAGENLMKFPCRATSDSPASRAPTRKRATETRFCAGRGGSP